jgi:tetratricopeptide (TPR) repeat protein
MLKPLKPHECHLLSAAEGWIELGCPDDAAAELKQIPSSQALHPDVLRVRYQLQAAVKDWRLAIDTAQLLCERTPGRSFGWVQLAYALHELKRTREAYDVLLPTVKRFPKEYLIRYNLACYSCQLDRLPEARTWLREAIAIAGVKTIRQLADTDPDLKPLGGKLLPD